MKHLIVLVYMLSFLYSCSYLKSGKEEPKINSDTKVYADSFFNSLFLRSDEGFTGGDGTYSVLLPDGRTAWIFGDTFVGGVLKNNSRQKKTPLFVHNTCVVQENNSLHTYYQQIDGMDASWVIHAALNTTSEDFHEDSVWYWPGDGLVEENKLKVFFSEFYQADTGMWGFKWTGLWVAVFSLPDIKIDTLYKINLGEENDIHFGHAVFEDKGYTYIYGTKDGRLYIARYAGISMKNPWFYYTGEGWSLKLSEAVTASDFHVSEQFSIFKTEKTYILVTQDGFLSPDIISYTSATPYGPWENKKLIYKTPLPENNKNLFTYNALVHPQFTKNNELLISYNTNSLVLEDHFKNSDIYRPRFIRVPLEMIIKPAD